MNTLLQKLKSINLSSGDCQSLSKKDVQHKYKLLLKQHWETGVNYLCITKRKDWKKYSGSGIRWKKLLKSHPSKIITTLLYSTDCVDDLSEKCKLYTKIFDIPNNLDFANLIPEQGYNIDPELLSIIRKKVGVEILKEKCKKGGLTCKQNKSGIFNEDYQHLRREWALIGANSLKEKGTRSGICSEKWRNENVEKVKEICSKGGKIGGTICGKMFWWNNGTINTKSFECPGKEWKRGMLMSDKKRKQVYSNFAGHNRKERNEK